MGANQVQEPAYVYIEVFSGKEKPIDFYCTASVHLN